MIRPLAALPNTSQLGPEAAEDLNGNEARSLPHSAEYTRTQRESEVKLEYLRETYIVELSMTAKAEALKRLGDSVSSIAVKLGLSEAEVDANLEIRNTR